MFQRLRDYPHGRVVCVNDFRLFGGFLGISVSSNRVSNFYLIGVKTVTSSLYGEENLITHGNLPPNTKSLATLSHFKAIFKHGQFCETASSQWLATITH